MDYKTKFEEAERYVRRLTEEFNMLNMENARLQDEKRKLELRFNPNHDERGRFASGNGAGGIKAIDNSKKSVRLDSKGKPYKRPAVMLDREEYGTIIREIDDAYHIRYAGKRIGYLQSGFYNATYVFEIHGYNEYNIFRKDMG